ncbi:MAG: hypothetical protein ACK5JO_12240, partial [Halodesulfovibrio sp.]
MSAGRWECKPIPAATKQTTHLYSKHQYGNQAVYLELKMILFNDVNDFLNEMRFFSMPRVALLCLVVASLGFAIMVPQNANAATVNYSSNYRDVIGNAPFLDGPISIGGTNNIASHAENIYSYGNTVNINGGVVDTGIYGGYFNGITTELAVESNGNTVTIGAGFIGSSAIQIFGGYARSVNPWSMTASGNTVTINGGTASSAFGGLAYVGSMAGSASATASGNTVNLNGGTISNLYGGYATADYLGGTHTASGNIINISGGTVGSVFGGAVAAPYGTGVATNNIVTISGSPDLSAASLYGGYLSVTT